MADRDLKVRLRAEGAERVIRAIRGVASATKRTQSEAEKARAKTARDAAKAEQQLVKITQRAEEQKRREIRKTAEEYKRHLQSRAREEERSGRARDRAFSQARRGGVGVYGGGFVGMRAGAFSGPPSRWQRFGGAVSRSAGSAVEGLGAAGAPVSLAAGITSAVAALNAVAQNLGRVTTLLGQRAGLRSFEEQVVAAADVELAVTNLVSEAFAGQGADVMAREQSRIMDTVMSSSRASGRDPMEILAAMQGAMTMFGRQGFTQTAEDMGAHAQEARRLNLPVEELTNFANRMNTAFGANGAMSAEQLYNITAQQGLQGALPPSALAQNFGVVAADFANLVDPNRRGSSEELYRQFGATAQAIAGTASDPSTAAMLMSNLMTALGKGEVRDDIAMATGGRTRRRRGANGQMEDVVEGGLQLNNYRDERGVLDLGRYVADIEASGALRGENINEIVRDAQGRSALTAVLQARARHLADPEQADIGSLMGASEAAGAEFRDTSLSRVAGTQIDQMTLENNRELLDTIANSRDALSQADYAGDVGREARSYGVLGRTFLDNDIVREGTAMLARTDIGQTVLNSGIGQSLAGSGVFGAAGVLSTGVEKNRTRVALEDAQVERMATRIGQEVGRVVSEGPNPQNRDSGGPQSRG